MRRFCRIDVQHLDFDFLAGRDDLAGMDVLLGPAHFGDMDQAFDARLQLDEGAVIGDVGDAALEARIGRVFELDAFPRIGFELLHAERDALRLGVEADDLHLHALADMQRFGRVIDAAPRDVGDVQQTVDAAEIDERAVIGDVLDDAVEDLAFLQRGDQLRARFGAALFEHGAARDDDVAARAIHLEDLERLRRAEQRRDIAHRADIDLAAGQERDGAGKIDGEAAFDAAEDHAVDALIRLEALFQQRPRFLAARLLARELRFAILVFHPLEIDLDDVARLDLRLPARRGKFAQRDAAFRFQSDIDQHGVVFDGQHPAFDDGSFQSARGAERFIE